jgi:hypothetical protein
MEPRGSLPYSQQPTAETYAEKENSAPIIDKRHINLLLLHLLTLIISFTLKMKATRASETSVYNKPTKCHIPEDSVQNYVDSFLIL